MLRQFLAGSKLEQDDSYLLVLVQGLAQDAVVGQIGRFRDQIGNVGIGHRSDNKKPDWLDSQAPLFSPPQRLPRWRE